MRALRIRYFVSLFLIICSACCADASCDGPGGKTIKPGDHHIVDCETLYRCIKRSDNYELLTYSACAKRKCNNPVKVRDADISKPWPECCAHYRCRSLIN